MKVNYCASLLLPLLLATAVFAQVPSDSPTPAESPTASPAPAETPAPSASPAPAATASPSVSPTPASPATPAPAKPALPGGKRDLGVNVTGPASWTEDAAKSEDMTLAYRFSPGPGNGTVQVKVEGQAATSLRGIWTYLRYSVVVEKGASILKDSPVKIAGLKGRELQYETYTNGVEERHLEIDLISRGYLITMLYDCPKASFYTQLPAVKQALFTMKVSADVGKADATTEETP